MKVRFTPRARADALRVQAWWEQHRPSAPGVFERELSSALERLRATPGLGVPYERARLDAVVRRVLLRTTRHHLYYAHDGEDLAVLAIWGAERGHGPRL
jgi:plasmid stabilization system protein ParE